MVFGTSEKQLFLFVCLFLSFLFLFVCLFVCLFVLLLESQTIIFAKVHNKRDVYAESYH